MQKLQLETQTFVKRLSGHSYETLLFLGMLFGSNFEC